MSHILYDGSHYRVCDWCSTVLSSRVRSRHIDALALSPRIIREAGSSSSVYFLSSIQSQVSASKNSTRTHHSEPAPLYILFLPSIYQSLHLPTTTKKNGQQLIFSCWHSCTIVSLITDGSVSLKLTFVHRNIPGLDEEIRNLRRPLNNGAYYSCSQQDWDHLCRQTLVPVSKAKATTALMKKSKAGKIHETADGEAALRRCSACTKGNNGNGYDCYLSSNGTTKTCAHCAFSNKSKCGMYPSLAIHVSKNTTNRD
jgi:hypothetical protein